MQTNTVMHARSMRLHRFGFSHTLQALLSGLEGNQNHIQQSVFPQGQAVSILLKGELFLWACGGICQLCFFFFSAVCPKGTARECYCFLRCRFCHHSLVGLGAFLRLPTDLRESATAACVGVGCVGAHIRDRVQHPHVKKTLYLSQQYMFLAFSLSSPPSPGAVVGICSSRMVDQKHTVLQLPARIIRFVLPCVVTQAMM